MAGWEVLWGRGQLALVSRGVDGGALTWCFVHLLVTGILVIAEVESNGRGMGLGSLN